MNSIVTDWASSIPVALSLLIVFILIIYKLKNKQKPDLQELINTAFTVSTIPTGLQLLWCALFRPEQVLSISDIRVQIAIIGFVVLYVAIIGIGKAFRNDPAA